MFQLSIRSIAVTAMACSLAFCRLAAATAFDTMVPPPRASGAMELTLDTFVEDPPVGSNRFTARRDTILVPFIPRNITPAQKAALLKSYIDAAGIPGVTTEVLPPANGEPYPRLKINNSCGMYARDQTGEAGSSGRVIPGPPNTPPAGSSSGSMYRYGAMSTQATGLDGFDNPSIVTLGIQERYVSELPTFPGESSLDMLVRLAADLEAHGIPMTLDPLQESLAFSDSILPGESMVWGSSDTGFDYVTGMTMNTPEPASIGVLLGGVGVAVCRRPRRSHC